jgi:hypothetical protein
LSAAHAPGMADAVTGRTPTDPSTETWWPAPAPQRSTCTACRRAEAIGRDRRPGWSGRGATGALRRRPDPHPPANGPRDGYADAHTSARRQRAVEGRAPRPAHTPRERRCLPTSTVPRSPRRRPGNGWSEPPAMSWSCNRDRRSPSPANIEERDPRHRPTAGPPPPAQALARIELPPRLAWSGGDRTKDLADRADRIRAYELVMPEGTPDDVLSYVDPTLLLDAFEELNLPGRSAPHGNPSSPGGADGDRRGSRRARARLLRAPRVGEVRRRRRGRRPRTPRRPASDRRPAPVPDRRRVHTRPLDAARALDLTARDRDWGVLWVRRYPGYACPQITTDHASLLVDLVLEIRELLRRSPSSDRPLPSRTSASASSSPCSTGPKPATSSTSSSSAAGTNPHCCSSSLRAGTRGSVHGTSPNDSAGSPSS